MTIAVTGGLGYLGSRLIRELPDDPRFVDRTVRIVDNFRQPRFHALWDLPSYGDYEFVEADVRDESRMREVMDGASAVIHLAAITNAPESFDIPELTWEVNHEGALTVYEAAKDADVDSFVNISTTSVYGRTEREIEESFDCEPESPYGEAKLEAEQEMLDRYDGTMDLTALRLGTIYGWTRGMRFDTVVDKFALLAATDQPLTVYEGAEEQKRPYLHVRDATNAIRFAVAELGDGRAYNVVGQNAPLRRVVDAIERWFPDVEIEHTEAEQLNQLSYIVSDDRIRERGFETGYDLDDGVAELADKFRAFL